MTENKPAPESQTEHLQNSNNPETDRLHDGDNNPSRTRYCEISELRVTISGTLENGATFSAEGTITDVGHWDARDFLYNFRYCIPSIEIEE